MQQSADVHPDVGIGLRHLPSAYVAMVEVRDAAAETAEVVRALAEWADKNGYDASDVAEVFTTAGYPYEVAVPTTSEV